jgi:hypothetical protein
MEGEPTKGVTYSRWYEQLDIALDDLAIACEMVAQLTRNTSKGPFRELLELYGSLQDYHTRHVG